MITYEDIKKANEAIRTTDIKGKEYAEVNQRIKAFRMVYPDGFISTSLLSNDGGVCVFKALVGCWNDNGEERILGTGTAYEKEGSSFINKTSYIENCETSAVGRALGMAGFGIDTSIASAEEVANAQLNQVANEKIGEVKVKALRARCNNDNVPEERINKLYNVKDFAELTEKQYSNINQYWEKIMEMNNGEQGAAS